MLKDYEGTVEINGVTYNSIQDAIASFKASNSSVSIRLLSKTDKHVRTQSEVFERDNRTYSITVKAYMTRQATPDFDFMLKNKNIPMPYRTMVGTIENETPGMYYMKLHGDILQERTLRCMCCGRPITNPVSQYFGMGPECGGHNYVNPFYSKEELQEAVGAYKKRLQSVTWEGWLPKSSIIEKEVLDG